MRFGLCTVIDNIDKIEKIGYDYLETSVTKLSDMPEPEFKEKIKLVNDSSIDVECFNVLFPKSMCLLDNSEDWDYVSGYLHKAFERIKMLDGKIVVFGSGKCRACMPGMSFDVGHRRLLEVVSKTGEIADKFGITIVVEPLNTSESNTVNTVAEGAILRADVNMKNVGLLADSYHMFRENESLANIERVGELAHTHVALLDGRKYPVIADPMLKEFFKSLNSINYTGRVSVEGKTEDIDTDAVLALKVLKELENLK